MMFDRVLENNYITRDETGAMDDSMLMQLDSCVL